MTSRDQETVTAQASLEEIAKLKRQIRQRDEAYSDLKSQFEILQS